MWSNVYGAAGYTGAPAPTYSPKVSRKSSKKSKLRDALDQTGGSLARIGAGLGYAAEDAAKLAGFETVAEWANSGADSFKEFKEKIGEPETAWGQIASEAPETALQFTGGALSKIPHPAAKVAGTTLTSIPAIANYGNSMDAARESGVDAEDARLGALASAGLNVATGKLKMGSIGRKADEIINVAKNKRRRQRNIGVISKDERDWTPDERLLYGNKEIAIREANRAENRYIKAKAEELGGKYVPAAAGFAGGTVLENVNKEIFQDPETYEKMQRYEGLLSQ